MARFSWSWILLGPFLLGGGCEQRVVDQAPAKKVTPADVRRDASRALETATEFTQQNKDAFQQDLESRLEGLDDEIATLRAKGRDLTDEAKANWEQRMADLESKRDAARVKLSDVRESSAEAWNDVQKGAQSAWKELTESFQDASQHFNSSAEGP